MNYKEKTSQSKYYVQQLKLGRSSEDMDQELLNNGIKSYNIPNIRKSAKKIY